MLHRPDEHDCFVVRSTNWMARSWCTLDVHAKPWRRCQVLSRELSPNAGYERLLRQQLRPAEVLDGIFASGPTLTIAITSDRLLIIAPTGPNGWELKSIPWRLLTEIVPDPSGAALDAEAAIHLRYAQPDKTGSRTVPRRDVDPEADTPDDEPVSAPANELILALPRRSGRMASLLRARLAGPEPG